MITAAESRLKAAPRTRTPGEDEETAHNDNWNASIQCCSAGLLRCS
ncbi:unnamed protein product [Ectocarpus sp. CCAP 1310/34]|nr:unnamed protein product [Ectocarpus sp. CCAP 1310/34]